MKRHESILTLAIGFLSCLLALGVGAKLRHHDAPPELVTVPASSHAGHPLFASADTSAIKIQGPDTTGNPIAVGADVVATFTTGRTSSIGTSAVQLTASSVACTKGVVVKAAAANTAKVYVGGSTVTANSADATDGVELAPGDSVTFPVSNVNLLYGRSTATGQVLFWGGA